jgi:signal transduction histidine kinase
MGKRTLTVLALGALTATLLLIGEDWVTRVAAFSTILGVITYLAVKQEQTARQAGDLAHMRAAYEQLDQQAKLIIRTDLVLHRTQEELDRRLASLLSLHRLGRQLQVSLRPDAIYGVLDEALVQQLGFSRGLLGLCPSLETVEWHAIVGLEEPAAAQLAAHLTASGLLKSYLTRPLPHVVTAAEAGAEESALLNLLGVPSAIVAAILPHAGPAGCLVLGRHAGVAAGGADQDLAAILVNQLATAVENSALYDETWGARQELERKVRERTHELAEANAELIRLNTAKSNFVSAVSHELRTPLAAIKGYASLLAGGQFGALAAPQRERVAKIEKHADLLTLLINNLLDIARIESGRVTMERRNIPVEEFFATIQDQVRPQMEAKRLRYTADLDGIKHLTGDPQHLQRVFVNLLSNAVKYTPEGGDIRLGLTRDGAHLLIAVRDSGCGISADDLPKLFQEFYRAADPINQQVHGTGLGLALVKRIVEAHQGTISVDSAPGRGSTFSVRLPLGSEA